VALNWQRLYEQFFALPERMYKGEQTYDGPLAAWMRQERLPQLLVQMREQVIVGNRLNVVGVGAAFDPECVPAVTALLESSRGVLVSMYLQDPGYAFERGRRLVRTKLQADRQLFPIAEEGEYYVDWEHMVYMIRSNTGPVYLDPKPFPPLHLPSHMQNCVVTLANVLNYLDVADVMRLLADERMKLVMLANTQNKGGFVLPHSRRYEWVGSLLTEVEESLGYHIVDYAEENGEEVAVIVR